MIKVIGVPEITVDGTRHTRFRSHRVPALIGFLASQERSATRKTIARSLWPSIDDERARHNLRQTLVYCRQLLGRDSITAKGEILSLDPSLGVDRLNWNELVARVGTDEAGSAACQGLLTLAGQPFLEGIEDDWVIEERERMKAEAVRVLADVAERLVSVDAVRALAISERLREIDPADEAAVRAQIHSLNVLGRGDEAKEVLARFEAYLLAEFGLPPSTGLKSLVDPHRSSPSADGSKLQFDSAIRTLLDVKQWNEAAELAISWVPYLERSGLGGLGLPAYEAILDRRPKKFAPDLEARFTLALSRVYHLAGMERKAMSLALSIASKGGVPKVRASAYLLACRAATRLFLPLEAQRCLKECMRIARDNGLEEELQRALLYSVEVALKAGDFDKCESRALRAIQTFRKLGDSVNVLRVLITRASAAQALGRESDLQIVDIEVWLEEIRTEGVPIPASLFNGIGRIREGAGDLPGAEAAYDEGVALARESGDDFSLAIGLTHLGDLYERVGRADEAIRAHGEALRAREPIEDLLGKACSHRGLARAHLAIADMAQACEHAAQSAALFQDASDLNGYVSAVFIMVLVQKKLGEHQKAAQLAKRALTLFDSLGTEAVDQMGPTYEAVLDEVRVVLGASISA